MSNRVLGCLGRVRALPISGSFFYCCFHPRLSCGYRLGPVSTHELKILADTTITDDYFRCRAHAMGHPEASA